MSSRVIFDGLTMSELRAAAVVPPELGGRPDIIPLSISSVLPNVSAVTQDLAPQGGTTIRPITPGTLTIVSDSVEDHPGGTGAGTVQVKSLDATLSNGDPTLPYQPYVQTPVALDGTTPVVVAVEQMRAIEIFVTSRGSGATGDGSNIGTLTATIVTPQLIVRPDDGISITTHLTLPIGWVAWLEGFFMAWSSSSQPLLIRCFGSVGSLFQPIQEVLAFEAQVEDTNNVPLEVPAFLPNGASTRCTAIRIGGGGTTPADLRGTFIAARLPT